MTKKSFGKQKNTLNITSMFVCSCFFSHQYVALCVRVCVTSHQRNKIIVKPFFKLTLKKREKISRTFKCHQKTWIKKRRRRKWEEGWWESYKRFSDYCTVYRDTDFMMPNPSSSYKSYVSLQKIFFFMDDSTFTSLCVSSHNPLRFNSHSHNIRDQNERNHKKWNAIKTHKRKKIHNRVHKNFSLFFYSIFSAIESPGKWKWERWERERRKFTVGVPRFLYVCKNAAKDIPYLSHMNAQWRMYNSNPVFMLK